MDPPHAEMLKPVQNNPSSQSHILCEDGLVSWISRLEYTSYSTSTTMPSMHLDQMITLTGVTIAVVFHMYMAFCAVAYLPYVFLDSTAPALVPS